ncbi:MAG: MFS transporter [Halanaerobium sp.]|nr:MFS transporter [Halanaerobium sp.]
MEKETGKRFDFSFIIFIWHGFFLALTMSMLDFNTVFPALITELIDSKVIFGLLYSIMLGAPLIFNIIFGHYMQSYRYKKKFLMLGIYLRSLSYLGMAVFTYLFARQNPVLVISSFFFWILLFSISGGFAGLAYTDIIGKLFKKEKRGQVYTYKQFASSIAAFLGALVVTKIFSPGQVGFPINYSLTLLIGFAGLFAASLAFWFIKEPPSKLGFQEREPLVTFVRKIPALIKTDSRFSRFILVENLTSFSLMILPFYMVFAREHFAVGEEYIGRYLLFQIGGTILSNLFWGFIAKRLGSRIVVRICIFLGGAIPVIAVLLSPFGPDIYAVVFVLVGFIISGRKIGFDPYFLEIAPEEERTVYLGVRGTMNFLIVLMPIIGGIFIDLLGYHITFIMVTVVMLSAFYLIRSS